MTIVLGSETDAEIAFNNKVSINIQMVETVSSSSELSSSTYSSPRSAAVTRLTVGGSMVVFVAFDNPLLTIAFGQRITF